jgi:hypothetical protein
MSRNKMYSGDTLMFAIRQIIEDPQDVIPIPPELRHRLIEVIFIAIDQEPERPALSYQNPTLASLAGCWEGEQLEREPQGDYENRREFK